MAGMTRMGSEKMSAGFIREICEIRGKNSAMKHEDSDSQNGRAVLPRRPIIVFGRRLRSPSSVAFYRGGGQRRLAAHGYP